MQDAERYQKYLCSRKWNEKKQAVHRRAGGMCERCHMREIDHVHHLTYIRKYDERLDDLLGNCAGCHEYEHALRDVDPAWHLNEGYVPLGEEMLPCVKCNSAVKEGLARNNKGEWMCQQCAFAANLERASA